MDSAENTRRCNLGPQDILRRVNSAKREVWGTEVQAFKESDISCGYLVPRLWKTCSLKSFKRCIIFYFQMHANMQREL